MPSKNAQKLRQIERQLFFSKEAATSTSSWRGGGVSRRQLEQAGNGYWRARTPQRTYTYVGHPLSTSARIGNKNRIKKIYYTLPPTF